MRSKELFSCTDSTVGIRNLTARVHNPDQGQSFARDAINGALIATYANLLIPSITQ
jgi:hypothetical protein